MPLHHDKPTPKLPRRGLASIQAVLLIAMAAIMTLGLQALFSGDGGVLASTSDRVGMLFRGDEQSDGRLVSSAGVLEIEATPNDRQASPRRPGSNGAHPNGVASQSINARSASEAGGAPLNAGGAAGAEDSLRDRIASTFFEVGKSIGSRNASESNADRTHPEKKTLLTRAFNATLGNPRIAGTLQAVGGAAQLASGFVAIIVPEPATTAGGIFLAGNGLDDFIAGVRTAVSGDFKATAKKTIVTEGLVAVGVDRDKAEIVGTAADLAIGIGGTLKAEKAIKGSRATTQRLARSPHADSDTAARIASTRALRIPQGLTPRQFDRISTQIRSKADELGLGSDIVVQGSRAGGTARAASDIDIAIKVSPDRFNTFLNNQSRLASPRPGSSLSDTRLRAIETGKIQAGEARLSRLRQQLANDLGIDVDLSVIRRGGQFDNGPQLPLSFRFSGD